MHLHGPRSRAVLLFLACVAFFAVANFSIFPLMLLVGPDRVFGMFFVAAWYSTIGGQIALHAIWCVLAPLHWIQRMLVGATSGLVLYGAFTAGFALYALHHGFPGEELLFFLVGLLCLPLFLLAAQTPLWIMRIWFRWRIAHRNTGPTSVLQPLGIRDLMIATACVAMSLAAAQAARSISEPSGNRSIVGLTVAALIVIVISAITVLPPVLAALRARRLLMALGVVLLAEVAIIEGSATLMMILTDEPVGWETFVATIGIAVGFSVILTTPMLIARKLGYRLLWGRF